ncbi:hypothetical protein [Acidomonas methanolica]|uniref:hypothetical protein n=1 Tax=Acidomonas methanolica TaxID=437 RepID=UPI00211A0300|nr:hypothetical protein [Acidomonas methanolica]MCQ9155011.1 hypothetical protein [Acidomonas methanolica]
MTQSLQNPDRGRVVALKSTAQLMTLKPGLFCVFYAAGQGIGVANGLPGVRLSPAPGTSGDAVTITTMTPDGWLGATDGGALVRVVGTAAQILVTSYDMADATREMPRLQVVQIGGVQAAGAAEAGQANGEAGVNPRAGSAARTPAAQARASQAQGRQAVRGPDASPVSGAPVSEAAAAPQGQFEVAAHIQRRGDVGVRLGEWMGVRGSQAWIEGFGIAPIDSVPVEDIEYQAVLGKNWLSPWVQGGQYCGSRGMALPILGLRVRLKGAAEKAYDLSVSATFTDGSAVGPVGADQTLEAESLAPLEAFLVEFRPRSAPSARAGAKAAPASSSGKRTATKPVAPPPSAPAVAAGKTAKKADPVRKKAAPPETVPLAPRRKPAKV